VAGVPGGAVVFREITDACRVAAEVLFEATLITSQKNIAPLAILPSGFLFCAAVCGWLGQFRLLWAL
jgi:hypothetical protein